MDLTKKNCVASKDEKKKLKFRYCKKRERFFYFSVGVYITIFIVFFLSYVIIMYNIVYIFPSAIGSVFDASVF